ncbi:MAG: (2Fe-2S)-binding protein [Bryobacter sp.]|jgi:aerobic-type carbon monoxide dehydrogenase small subunit (CoxS/CutS family)|nr:(2Fe-2S)-binding protein [Bryobacter sp.]
MQLHCEVNGEPRTAECEPLDRLLDVLREQWGLTGTKEGCGEGECGACAVLLDGVLVNSCLIPAARAEGARLTTIEGLAAHPLTRAFSARGAVQCGFCTPGMILAAAELLDHNPTPAEPEIRAALAGTLCRCTGYSAIVEAVQACAKTS